MIPDMAKKARKNNPKKKAPREGAKRPKRPPRKKRAARKQPGAKAPVKVIVVGDRNVPPVRRGRPPSTWAWLYEELGRLKPGKALRLGESGKGLTSRQIACMRQAARRWCRSCGARVRTTTVSGMLFIVRLATRPASKKSRS